MKKKQQNMLLGILIILFLWFLFTNSKKKTSEVYMTNNANGNGNTNSWECIGGVAGNSCIQVPEGISIRSSVPVYNTQADCQAQCFGSPANPNGS